MFIIAEIGQAHDGSVGILHSFIDAVAKTGVDAIKFQTHIAEAESSIQEPFRTRFSYVDKTRYDYWQRMTLDKSCWFEIKQHCEENDIEFMSSPFSCAAVDLLEELDVQRYKIGSGEVSNLLLLEKIARTGKIIILSSGMSSFAELDTAIGFLGGFNSEISVMQCTTQYPTTPDSYGFNVIGELKSRYNIPVGFSDHSGEIYAGIGAAACGAELLEVHVTFSKQMFGPDSSSSLTIEQLSDLVKGVRAVSQSLASPVNKSTNDKFKDLKKIFEKSLAVNKDLKAGAVLQFDDLEAKKPADCGIPANQFKAILGKKLKTDKSKYDFLSLNDLIP